MEKKDVGSLIFKTLSQKPYIVGRGHFQVVGIDESILNPYYDYSVYYDIDMQKSDFLHEYDYYNAQDSFETKISDLVLRYFEKKVSVRLRKEINESVGPSNTVDDSQESMLKKVFQKGYKVNTPHGSAKIVVTNISIGTHKGERNPYNLRVDFDICYDKKDLSNLQKIFIQNDFRMNFANTLLRYCNIKPSWTFKEHEIESLNEQVSFEVEYDTDKQNKIDEFVKFVQQELDLKEVPDVVIQDGKKQLKTTAQYQYGPENKVIVNGKDRMMVDVLRSIAHELVHHQQNELGKLKVKPADVGGDIEDEANAVAGQLIKKFAQSHPDRALIYEQHQAPKLNIDALIDRIIKGWGKKGAINMKDMNRYSVRQIFNDEEKQPEFKEKLLDKTIEALCDGTIVLERESYISFYQAGSYFNPIDCDSTDVNHLVESGLDLSYYEFDEDFDAEDTEWDEFMYTELNALNIKQLRRFTKAKHMSAEYLLAELPDLCKRIAIAYTKAQYAANSHALRELLVKGLDQALKGQEPKFDYNKSRIEVVQSTDFYSQSKESFNDHMRPVLKDAFEYYMEETEYTIDYMDQFFQNMENAMGGYDDADYNERINGFIDLDCTKIGIADLVSHVDNQYFNNLVGEEIQEFFKRYD